MEKSLQPNPRMAHLSTEEMQHDLAEARQDLRNCESGLETSLLYMPDYGAVHARFRERIDGNKRQIAVIERELRARGVLV